MQHVEKIVKMLAAVVKAGNMRDEDIVLVTKKIGVPNIDAGDIRMAAIELADMEEKLKRMDRLAEAIRRRINELNGHSMMRRSLGEPALMIGMDDAFKKVPRLQFTGTGPTITLF